LTVKNNTGSF